MRCGWIVDPDQSPMKEEKIIWGGECQVHRPLFTERFGESAMFTDISLQVALVGQEFRASAKFTDLSLQIPFAGAKFTDLSLQIPLCRCQVYRSPFTDPSLQADGKKNTIGKMPTTNPVLEPYLVDKAEDSQPKDLEFINCVLD